MLWPPSPSKAVSQREERAPLGVVSVGVVSRPPPETMDELSFKEGDLIMLKTRVGAEWLRGKLVGGKEGIFPRTYVEIVVSV